MSIWESNVLRGENGHNIGSLRITRRVRVMMWRLKLLLGIVFVRFVFPLHGDFRFPIDNVMVGKIPTLRPLESFAIHTHNCGVDCALLLTRPFFNIFSIPIFQVHFETNFFAI